MEYLISQVHLGLEMLLLDKTSQIRLELKMSLLSFRLPQQRARYRLWIFRFALYPRLRCSWSYQVLPSSNGHLPRKTVNAHTVTELSDYFCLNGSEGQILSLLQMKGYFFLCLKPYFPHFLLSAFVFSVYQLRIKQIYPITALDH